MKFSEGKWCFKITLYFKLDLNFVLIKISFINFNWILFIIEIHLRMWMLGDVAAHDTNKIKLF